MLCVGWRNLFSGCAVVLCQFLVLTKKKRSSRLSIVTPFQLRPEKKDTVVWPPFLAPFQLPLLRRSNYDRKKNYTVVCPLLPLFKYDRKKNVEKLFMRRRTSTGPIYTKSSDFHVKLNVLNLSVTNLYLFNLNQN